MCPQSVQPAAGFYLDSTQPILIKIVGIDFFYAQCRVGIAFPAPAQVEFFINAPDAVVA